VFAALLLIALPTTIVAAPIPGLPAVAAAQTTEEAKPADLMVPARDIPAQADTDERLARDVQAQAQDRRQLDELRARLDVIMKSVLRLASQLRGTNLLDLPATRLEALERRWMFYQRELESWRRDQQVSVDSNADEAAQIASRREAWEATIAPPNREDVVAALVVRANEVLAALKTAEAALAQPMSEQLAMGRRATSVQSSIQSGLKAVRAAIANSDQRLWHIDSPPLWQVWSEAAASPSALSAATAGVGVDLQFLGEYRHANRDRWRGHAIFALLLLPFLLWLSARSKRLFAADPELAQSGKALTRPISSWLVLVLLGALFFEADGPLLLQELALLLAVIPVLRLLPEPVFKVLGPWPYAATALYVLQRMGFALAGDPLWDRVHLLVVTALTLAALVWLLLEGPHHAQSGLLGRAQRLAVFVGYAAIALLCVSLVANLIGNVSLAEVLTEGTLDSGYIGLALYAGAAVLNSIVRLSLVRRQGSRFEAMTQRAGPLLQAVARLINVAAVIAWILAILSSFRMLRPVLRAVRAVLTYPLEIGKISVTLGSVILFGVAVYAAFWIARWMRVILSDEVLPKMALPRGVANSVATLSYYALVLLGLMFALAAAGFQMSQFAIVFGALGVGIGFGLQNIVNNFVSGLILMFERPIQPGDTVEVTGTSGVVREIGMRATTLKTGEGADVVIPNGTLLSEKLINWTMGDLNRRVDVDLGVAYGADLRKVASVLMDVTKTCDGIAPQPAPAVIFKGFGPSTLDFGIRAWTGNFADFGAIRSELAMRVNEALLKAGIEIPFPQQDVHIRSIAPEVRANLAGELRGTDASTSSRDRAAQDPAPRSATDTTNLPPAPASSDRASSDTDPF
jgi:small-conductance mechanosensitive channel